MLDELLQRLQELRADGAVDRAVIARQRHRHRRHRDEVAVADDDALLRGAHREDRDLRRIEHGDELLDAEHAEVRDRERAALEVCLLQLVVACAADELGAWPAISAIDLRSACWMTGTTSPCGAATAMPTFALGWMCTSSST